MKKEKTKNLSYQVSAVNPSSERDFNMDILRIIATLLTMTVHFFLNTEFYSYPVDGIVMNAALVLRNLGMLCVPLFMLLTGYLQGEKNISPDLRYYSKITKFIIPHVLVIIFCIAVNTLVLGDHCSVGSAVKSLFNFPGYSWYVEMYIGLFLMIPFLNIIWNNLDSKKKEHTFIAVLISVSMLATVLNVYSIGSDDWLRADSKPYTMLVPDFWTNLYPIAYYFVGAYLKKHKESLIRTPLTSFLIFAGCFSVSSVYSVIRNAGAIPSVYRWLAYASVFNLVNSAAFLLFIASLDFSKAPEKLRTFVRKLSDLSFVAYLVSTIPDKILYPLLERIIPSFSHKLPVMSLMIIVVAVCSYTLSFIINLLSKPAEKSLQKQILRIKSKN